MKYIALNDWEWHKGKVSVVIKAGEIVSDKLEKELIQTLLMNGNIMPASPVNLDE